MMIIGIELRWTIPNLAKNQVDEISHYELFSYQESIVAPSPELWKQVGCIRALTLPMGCTLSKVSLRKYVFEADFLTIFEFSSLKVSAIIFPSAPFYATEALTRRTADHLATLRQFFTNDLEPACKRLEQQTQ